MAVSFHPLFGVALVAVGGAVPALAQNVGAASAAAQAQAGPQQGGSPLQEVIVTGIRASLQSAEDIKKNSDQIVDSIVAEDIGKLPDINVADALQRVTGIQIGRDVGEGSIVAIRGLPQILTTLNGREAFTAGGGRTFNFEDVPAELLRGLDVYKSPTANLVEGGLGGTIDLRTRRPFDFKGLELDGSAMGRYADLVEQARPQASGLVSDRWETGIGEVGALLSLAYQDRGYRQDLDSSGAPYLRTDLIPGETVVTPNGSYEPLIVGDRQRTGVDGVMQWRAQDDLLFTGEVDYQGFRIRQDQYGVNIPAPKSATPVAGTFSTFPGTSDFMTGTYANVPFSTFGTSRDITDVNRQYSLNGKWTPGKLTLSTDLSYTRSTDALYYTELDLASTAPTFTQNLATGVPSGTVTGVDTTNPASFHFGPLTRSENHFVGNEKAGQIDAEYGLQGFLSSLMGGFRYGDRRALFTPIRFFVSPATTAATAHPDLFGLTPYTDYFGKTDSSSPFTRAYLTAIPDLLRFNFNGVRNELGITRMPTISPLAVFDIDEKTYAGYLRANYRSALGSLPFDGNLGVRVVRTDEVLVGARPLFVNGTQSGYLSFNQSTDYTDALPSFNFRLHLKDDLQLRLAASKVITRPDFTQLSPSLTLVPANGQASSGNPSLRPLRANQLDASLEWYFRPDSSAYLATFYKKVQGFITTTVTPNVVIDGITYNLAQPSNGADGSIKGAEVGYQQFFTFLPGWWSGFGVQANYTYVKSSAPSSVAGLTTGLPQLSQNSYNVVGIYEKGPVSARLAYNWRSQFYESIFVGTGSLGANPVYRHAYGWLDASVVYDVNHTVALTVEGANLLRTKRQGFYSVETRPNDRTIDDRQILAGVRLHW